MMTYILLTISAIILLILVFFFRLILKSFQNKHTRHTGTPDQDGIPFREVNIPTRNNRKLYGWLIETKPDQPTIVLVHGWGRNVERVQPYIGPLFRMGYNLLAFDSRHHGDSDKDNYSTMVKFAEDIIASVDFLYNTKTWHNHNIGVVGLSIGGAATIYASARDDRIKSVITVGAFADPLDVMVRQLKRHHIPYVPFGRIIIRILERRVGFRFHDVAPEKHIGKSAAYFLIIHGDEDETIPVDHFNRLLDAANNQHARHWLIAGRGHSDCHLEKDFWSRTGSHFEQTLKESYPDSRLSN